MVWILSLLLVFDFVALPALEVLLLDWRFFENFGQVLHLVSVTAAVPFVLAWRRDIEKKIDTMVEERPAQRTGLLQWTPATVFPIALLGLNLIGTVQAVSESLSYLGSLGTTITIHLSDRVIPEEHHLRRRSIEYTEPEPPEICIDWVGPRLLRVFLTRPLAEGESLLLVVEIYERGPHDIVLTREIRLDYNLSLPL